MVMHTEARVGTICEAIRIHGIWSLLARKEMIGENK